jgi:5-methylthioribose kinase
VVLKVFDTSAGAKVGTDLRSLVQKKLGKTDVRPNQGVCFVLKQPLPKFRTAAEWIVDIERVKVERDAMGLLGGLLPAGSVPDVLWFDEMNYVLAMACAPVGAMIWKKALLSGQISMDAAAHAGMLLAMMHSSTHNDAGVRKRYADPTFFMQQRTDAYLMAAAAKHPELGDKLKGLAEILLRTQACLIHGDYSPKNMFLVPREEAMEQPEESGKFPLSHLMLLDFEVAFYGHPAFDVATLINHFLLKGFYHRSHWRPFMLLADNFWETYRHTAAPDLVRMSGAIGGNILGGLMLARVDGKSPAEYLLTDQKLVQQVRCAGEALLKNEDGSLDHALDAISMHFDEPERN